MKKLLFILIALMTVLSAKSQKRDTIKTKPQKKIIIIDDTWKKKKEPQRKDIKPRVIRYYKKHNTDTLNILNTVKIEETSGDVKVRVGQLGVETKPGGTTNIRLWKRKVSINDGWGSPNVKIERINSWDDDNEFYGRHQKKFDGHWSGFELGLNTFVNTDYSMYSSKEEGFMDLYHPKSLAVNLNFIEWNIGLQEKGNTLGLVTGLGLEWNNYRFDKRITITEDENGIIQPVKLNDKWHIKKSKLTSLYLNVPLFVEWQIPTDNKKNRAHIALGVVGGLRISSHTKIKYKTNGDTEKDKDHDNFNLNTIRCNAMVRIGYRSLNFFATYGITRLFEDNKGPKLTPFTIGITLVSF